ncbi:hypothetical protein KFL_002050200 [Klebsormidium nitens]|uniref:Uncharacterized protein n=1 Tax=Klebsormidium nitens TaxID=105231 RepID=A0A1Y1I7V5_KLENI|nr:hypothetical protein KFL_002050200 [Klebsormidium nitens]|eukprot:GAQ84777.1 hypothetical protein KFL_002050200 [Klebsormidium nitens]
MKGLSSWFTWTSAGRCRSPRSGARRYFATFLDYYSKLSVVVPMKQKSEVAKFQLASDACSWGTSRTRRRIGCSKTATESNHPADVIFDEGIGGDGVVELGFDPTDGSQTAEGHNAQLHTEAQQGSKVVFLCEGNAAARASDPRPPRALSRTGAKMRVDFETVREGQSKGERDRGGYRNANTDCPEVPRA